MLLLGGSSPRSVRYNECPYLSISRSQGSCGVGEMHSTSVRIVASWPLRKSILARKDVVLCTIGQTAVSPVVLASQQHTVLPKPHLVLSKASVGLVQSADLDGYIKIATIQAAMQSTQTLTVAHVQLRICNVNSCLLVCTHYTRLNDSSYVTTLDIARENVAIIYRFPWQGQR